MKNLKKQSNATLDFCHELKRRRLARDNLIDFTRYTHGRYRPGEIHFEVAEKLELVEKGKIKRLMIFMPPRHGKSELSTRRFPAWFLGRNPLRDYISASYNKEMATGFGRDVRNIMNSPEYARLFPGVKLATDSQGKGRFHTNIGGGYLGAGIGSSMTGHGGHVLGIDDPIKDREDAMSKKLRDRVYNWYSSTAYTRLETEMVEDEVNELWSNPNQAVKDGLLKPFEGAIIITMTRWDLDDLAGRLLDDMDNGADQWIIINRPVTDEAFSFALWPEKYPVTKIKQMKKVMTDRDWSSLMMQSPIKMDGNSVKKEWIKYGLPKNPISTSMGVDLAISDKDKVQNAYTAIVVVQRDLNGDIYIVHAERERCTFHKIMQFIQRVYDQWKPQIVGIEDVQFQAAVVQEMFRTTNIPVRACNPGGKDKLVRFVPLQDRYELGYVYHSNLLPDWFEEELLWFPDGPFKDAVDALVYAYRELPNTSDYKIISTGEQKEFTETNEHAITKRGWGSIK
jgi:predicted phage terminase large subunit-like protein